MNAKVFAKGPEKCRLLTSLLGQNVEILDDYDCPKIQGLVKTDSLLICSCYAVRHKKGFTVPRGKQRCMENGLCNICKFCTCLLYLSLLLYKFVQLDMTSFHFEKLSLQNK